MIFDAPGQLLLFDADVRCRRCRRKVSDDDSRARQLGPKCLKILQREQTRKRGFRRGKA